MKPEDRTRMPLFRAQAVDHQRTRLEGELVLIQPISAYLPTLLLLVIVTAMLVFLAFASYARKETVRGYLVPDRGLIKVYSPEPAVLDGAMVSEGQAVRKGDVLFTLSHERTDASGGSVDADLTAQLEQQRVLLEQSIARADQEFVLNQERLRARIAALENERRALSRLRNVQRERVGIVREGLRAAEDLEQGDGVISRDELRGRRTSYLNEAERFEHTAQSVAATQRELTEARSSLASLPLEHQSARARLEAQLSALDEKRTERVASRAFAVVAPIDGRVTAVQASAGRAVRQDMPLCAIIPAGGQLQAEVFVPTRASGFIRPGQAVRLLYDAFPYEHYGIHRGQVREVSRTILRPDELPIPLEVREPVYRVRVHIPAQGMSAFRQHYPLQSGMSLTAHIVLERRSLLAWLLRPLQSLRGKV